MLNSEFTFFVIVYFWSGEIYKTSDLTENLFSILMLSFQIEFKEKLQLEDNLNMYISIRGVIREIF